MIVAEIVTIIVESEYLNLTLYADNSIYAIGFKVILDWWYAFPFQSIGLKFADDTHTYTHRERQT